MNKLFLVSGHSGSGKTTIMRRVMDNEIISFTTRPKRKGEVEGKDYKFITLDEFWRLKQQDKLIEWVKYANNYYGVDKEEFENKISKGHAYCIVDYHGMRQLKNFYSNCVTIFIYTSYEQAIKQMRDRGDDEDKIKDRMVTYINELQNRKEYDYVIKNNKNKLNNTIEIIKNIIESEVGL